MKTRCIGRLHIELNELAAWEGARLDAEHWAIVFQVDANYDVIRKARGWRRVIITRSYTQPRFRWPQPRLVDTLQAVVKALARLGHAPEGTDFVYQQVPAQNLFLEVALHEPCESHKPSTAVQYRRQRA